MAERVRDETVTIAPGVTRLLKFYPSRKSFVVTNPNSFSVRIHTRDNVSPTRGIQIGAGGTAGFNDLEDGEFVRWEWWVYAAEAGTIDTYEVIDDGAGGGTA